MAAAVSRLKQHWPFICFLPFAFCSWLLAYQFPLRQTIHVGGELALERRRDDEPFLRGFNGSQPAERVNDPADPRGYRWWFEESRRTGERPYRWSTADSSLIVPGAGPGLYLVELFAGNGRPDQQPIQTVWTAGSQPPLALSLPPGEPRRYRLLASANTAGDLRIDLRTEAFTPPGDPRELGFVLHQVRLQRLGSGLHAPAWPTLGWLALAVGTLYGLARSLRAPNPLALGLAAGAALAAVVCLALARPALTVFAPALGLLALGCAGLAVATWPLVLVASRRGIDRAEAAQLLGLVLLAFALRMAGMLHPQALFSDLGFHANNLFAVSLGQVFFTAGLPSDAGGGRTPYPPGAYLLLLPGALLAVGDEARKLLVQGGIALLDSLALVLIWIVLRRAGFSVIGAALGAACYLLPTPALESFSIGEYANLGGQALVLPLLALLGLAPDARTREGGADVIAARASSRPSRPLALSILSPSRPARPLALLPTVLLTAAVAVSLLAHSGVTLQAGALLASVWALAWLEQLRGQTPAIHPLRLTLGAAAGLSLALLLFYSAPQFVMLLESSGERSPATGTSPLLVLADSVAALLGLANPQNTRVPLPPLIGPLGLVGLGLALRSGEPRIAPLRLLLGGWWLGALLTLGLLVVSGQGVRWAIFLYPALCLGAGIALDAFWRRGRAGRLVALGALAVVLAFGMYTWVVTIRDFIHV